MRRGTQKKRKGSFKKEEKSREKKEKNRMQLSEMLYRGKKQRKKKRRRKSKYIPISYDWLVVLMPFAICSSSPHSSILLL